MREDDGQPLEDFDLLTRFNAGSEEAFARLVEKHHVPLLDFLFRYTRDQAASEDLAQETFLRLWKAAPDLRPAARLSTILFKIAYNLAVDRARRERSRSARARVESLDAASDAGRPDPADAPSASPDAAFEAGQRNAEVAAGLAELPETQRLALMLRVYEDRSYAEIAEIMELSAAAVESLLFRARRSLAGRLRP